MAKSSDAEMEILALAMYESHCRASRPGAKDWYGLSNADRWTWRKRAERRVVEYANGDPEDEGPW